jgi:hypothetical protein
MKITKRQLTRIIKEEKAKLLREVESIHPESLSREEEQEYWRGYADGYDGHPEDQRGWGPYFAGFSDGEREYELDQRRKG